MKKIIVTGLIVMLSLFSLALKQGDTVPDFKAKNQDGIEVSLSQFKGKPVLLYFYPKDDTPGCTKEACQFRDKYSDFKKLGVVIFGISKQDEKSHQKFIKKHKIPFDLLIDSDGAIAESLGVETMPIIGFHKRQSVLIGPDGKMAKFYDSVDPDKTADEVMKDLKELKLVPLKTK